VAEIDPRRLQPGAISEERTASLDLDA